MPLQGFGGADNLPAVKNARTFEAYGPGICGNPQCGRPFGRGDLIRWGAAKGERWHADCGLVSAQPGRPSAKIANPSAFQLAIFEHVKSNPQNLIVYARPGSGKTTSAVASAEFLPTNSHNTFLAFNKSIADELARRLPASVQASTFHSICFRAWSKQQTSRPKVESNKVRIIARQVIPEEAYKVYGAGVARLVSLAKGIGIGLIVDNTTDAWMDLVAHHDIRVERGNSARLVELAQEVYNESLALRSIIDFDDMLLFTALDNTPFERFDNVFIDESQDISAIQRHLLHQIVDNGRLIAIGDPRQCQPPGTMIALTGGKAKPVEDIREGDAVVTWTRRVARFAGMSNPTNKVKHTVVRSYRGKMHRISVSCYTTQATPNHRWVTRFAERLPDCWITYLMRQGDRFRVGWCQLFDNQGGLHLGTRTRLELADSVWILGVHTTKRAASIEESALAAIYGLPLVTFKEINGANHYDQDALDQVFSAVNGETNQYNRAIKLLTRFGRMIEYPFYSVEQGHRQGRTTIFETQTCNLLSGMMMLPVYDNDQTASWQTLVNDSFDYDGPVYSLAIERDETYVADGIVTHNSIYGWRSADAGSMDAIKAEFDCAELPLSISYRCPQAVVRLLQTIDPDIQASPTAPEGEVLNLEFLRLTDFLPTDAAICRTTAPVISLAYRLLAAGKPCKVMGRDIGRGLITLIHQLRPRDLNDLITRLESYREREVTRLNNAMKEDQAQAVDDKCESLMAAIAAITSDETASQTLETLEVRIESIFSDEPGVERTTLSTVHKAKGLEWKRVFILDPHRMPSPWARKDWQIQEEQNIMYVAWSRAQETLAFIKTEDIQ